MGNDLRTQEKQCQWRCR